MSEDQGSQTQRTLEMRVAAIEDKLASMTVTQDEMRAFMKVASLMAGNRSVTTALSPFVCNITTIPISRSVISGPILPPIIFADCIQAGVSVAESAPAGFGTLGQG